MFWSNCCSIIVDTVTSMRQASTESVGVFCTRGLYRTLTINHSGDIHHAWSANQRDNINALTSPHGARLQPAIVLTDDSSPGPDRGTIACNHRHQSGEATSNRQTLTDLLSMSAWLSDRQPELCDQCRPIEAIREDSRLFNRPRADPEQGNLVINWLLSTCWFYLGPVWYTDSIGLQTARSYQSMIGDHCGQWLIASCTTDPAM